MSGKSKATHAPENEATRAADELRDVANIQVDELFSIAALLEAAERYLTPGPLTPSGPLSDQDTNNVKRVVRIASERVKGVINEFNPYI